jgi:guanylate kinase
MAPATRLRVLVVIGPSGAGKSTVVRSLQRRGIVEVTPSWTTRPRRDDEAHDTVEHRFVSEDTFSEHQRAGRFLEVVAPFGLPYRYGLPAIDPPSGGRVPLVMVRAPLLGLVGRHVAGHLTYQVEDSYDRARERLLARHLDPSVLGSRLEGYEWERVAGRRLAARVFVNRASTAALVDAVTDAIAEDFGSAGRRVPCHPGR